MRSRLPLTVAVVAVATLLAFPSVVSANHSWGGYHWQHSSTSEFTIVLARNTTAPWTNMLTTVSSDWSTSTVLNTSVASHGEDPVKCDPTLGRVEVCNANYGNTGWLGVAQIWLYVGGGKHIAQGTVKNNDYYFGSSSYAYNNSAEQQHVICQEVGHTLGLNHQDESGASLNTCMDYYHNTSSTDLLSTHPNAGDYAELRCIYDSSIYGQTLNTTVSLPGGGSYVHTCNGTGHLDGSKPGGGHGHGNHGNHETPFPGAGSDASQWGRVVASSASGKEQTFFLDLGDGRALVTFVIWA